MSATAKLVAHVKDKLLRFSPLTLAVASLLVIESLLGLVSPTLRKSLTLIAGNTIRCPWTVFTASFVEANLLSLVLALLCLFLTAAVAEPIYGPTEFFKLIVVAAVSSGLVSFVFQYIEYIVMRMGGSFFSEIGGFYGVEGALLVAVKHVLPGQDVSILPGVNLPSRYLPGLYVVICTAWTVVSGKIALLRFAVVGTYAGWFYLRFIKPSGTEGMRGDPSADFALSTMFPPALQPAASLAFTAIARMFRLHRAPPPTLPVTTPATSTAGASTSGTTAAARGTPESPLDWDAARRREVGRQALEARLAAAGMQPLPTSQRANDKGSRGGSLSPRRGVSNAGSSPAGVAVASAGNSPDALHV